MNTQQESPANLNQVSTSNNYQVTRVPLFFREEGSPLFGWLHLPTNTEVSSTGMVICPPIGYEYMSSHRSLRHMADQFATEGTPAIRFDYDGTGNSAGVDEDSDRLGAWLESIRCAISQLMEVSGCTSVGLAGVRIGATMAAMIAEEFDLQCLVLWAPCVNGRHYIREMKLLGQSDEKGVAPDPDGDIESGGFVIASQTGKAISKIKLTKLSPRQTNVLIVARDDLEDDFTLRDQWREQGLSTEYMRMEGFADFLAPPHRTKVPLATIKKIVSWVKKQTTEPPSLSAARFPAPCSVVRIPGRNYLSKTQGTEKGFIEEKIVRFGSDGYLFGILSGPTGRVSNNEHPTIILLNSGAVHHVGVNRLYVLIARHLAQAGFSSLRMDIQGLGDAVIDDVNRENALYNAGITADVDEAISYLKSGEGINRFVLAGLCFGSYASFHSGLRSNHDGILECVVINPLTFYWKEGMSLDETTLARSVSLTNKYTQSMYKPGRWLKLLKGDVNIGNIFKAFRSLISYKLKSKLERSSSNDRDTESGQNLSRDINSLIDSGKYLSFIIADNDPGHDLLMLQAKETVLSREKRGDLSIDIIGNAYHTFPYRESRWAVIKKITENMQKRYANG